MFPKMGKTFPDDDERKVDRLKYQMAIAAALKRELGGSHRAIKIVMRWTGVSERTAKNWLAGTHGPAGEHLVELMRNSNEVMAAVLSLAGRGELQIGAGLQLRASHSAVALPPVVVCRIADPGAAAR